MKRLLCTLAALCAALTAIYAQTSLLRTYKAAETSKYRTENCRISGMKLSSAFTLGSPEGGYFPLLQQKSEFDAEDL